MTDVDRITQLRTLAVERAVANLGYGETEGNNRGRFIEEIGGKYLSEEDPDWCALFAGHNYRRAYAIALLGKAALAPFDMPRGWLYRSAPTIGRPDGVPEPGALRLVTALGKVGCHFTDPMLASFGDLVLWKRPGGHHVAIIEFVDDDNLIHTIEGNVGRYPAKVKRLTHDVTKEPHFRRFASLRTAAML